VTGSFGEYRPGHYHAGIDISTRGAVGMPVRAVADGRVVRLRASPYGYGRAIYIDIHDGERAYQIVCAHLSDFAPRWRALVEAEQERLGKYTVDFAVSDSSRVAAGEIVAYTGESGGGPPHLHFEVRQGDADPVNPLMRGWDAPDTTAPVIRSLRLVPLGLDGRVDGGLDPVVVPVKRESMAATGGARVRYSATRVPLIRGPVGVEASAADRVSGCDAARGVFSASLSLDGAKIFSTEFQSVSYDGDWADVELRYDYAAIQDGEGEFVRLFEPVGWAGAIRDSVDAGGVSLMINVIDEAGNQSRCGLRVEHDPHALEWWADRSRSTDGSPPSADGSRGERVPEARDALLSRAVRWRLEPEGLVVRLARGASHPHGDLLVREEVPGPMMLSVSPIALMNLMPVAASNRHYWYATSGLVDHPTGRPLTNSMGSDRVVRIQRTMGEGDSLETVAEFTWFVEGVPLRASVITAATGRSSAVIPIDGLYGPTLFTASSPPTTPLPSPGLRERGAPVRFDPLRALLKKPAEVHFWLPDSLQPIARRLAVYSVGRRGGVTSIDGALDDATGEFVATTRHLGTFVLLEDTVAPRLSSPRPAPGAVLTNARPRLSVRVADVGEGLDDEGVRFTIDGTRLIPEYDPEAGTIVARPKAALAAGPHRMEVRVSDKAGNDASIVSRFTVGAGVGGGAKSGGKAQGVKKPATNNPKGKKP